MVARELVTRGAFFLMAISLSGCASIVEGTDQSIRVRLSPDSATCRVTREGEQLASISQKEPFIKVSKSKNELEIECRAPDHIVENITIESSASGWGVVGCILIDLCITDYSTGALNKYPEEISIVLVPQNFTSEKERDEWFQRRRTSLETGWDRRISSRAEACESASNKEDCQDEVSELKKRKTKALERLERQRAETKITPSEPETISVESRLNRLKRLYNRGVINREEYESKRKEIMSGL
jgi:hypothetical protein